MLFKELKVLLSKKWWLRFLSSESLADGLRNTLSVIIPVFFLCFLQGVVPAMAGGLGVLLISITDTPGNRNQKINTAFRGLLVLGVTAVGTSYLWDKPVCCALFFFLMSFVWSMLGAFSVRAWLTGSSGIILACFIIGLKPSDPLNFSFWIIIGASWYLTISLIQAWRQPFRSLRFAIRECLNATADFLLLKKACYDKDVVIQQAYQMSMLGHLKVSEHQEAVRELLLSDYLVIKKNTVIGRKMLALALEVMALYEHVSAMSIDYRVLRNNLSGQALALLKKQIKMLASWVEYLAYSAAKHKLSNNLLNRIEEIEMELADGINLGSNGVNGKEAYFLEQMEQHMSTIVKQLRNLTAILKKFGQNQTIETAGKDYVSFWDDAFTFYKLKSAFNFQSPIFRFSSRMAIILSAVYLLSVFVLKGDFAYWLLLTIVVVVRPRSGITWKRNAERLIGTSAGVIVGSLLLLLVSDRVAICVIAAIFLWGYFSFIRLHYMVSVFFITIAVLIGLELLNGLTWSLWVERLWFTVLGCFFAALSLFIFPFWEHWSLKSLLQTAKNTNLNYLEACIGFLKNQLSQQNLALARKASHTALARLSEGLNWLWPEPGKNKLNLADAKQIQTLLYRINAGITALWVDPQMRKEVDTDILKAISYAFQRTDSKFSLNSLNTENLKPYQGIGLLLELSKELKKSGLRS